MLFVSGYTQYKGDIVFLSDQVQIIAEGTMAPKVLINSRFAIVDAGWYPEQNYYTFMVDFEESTLI